jgi:hypothetical protein
MSGALGDLTLDIADTIKKGACGVLEVRGPGESRKSDHTALGGSGTACRHPGG